MSEQGTIRRILEQTIALENDFAERAGESEEISFDARAALEQMRIDVRNELSLITAKELFLLKRYGEGAKVTEIASELSESPKITIHRLYTLQKRVLYRLSKRPDYRTRAKVTAPASRLEAFAELQRRLFLTSAKAAKWQNAIREARR